MSSDEAQPSSLPRASDLVRVVTCGSVDDGKSTLIGRLLFDSNVLMEDAITGLARDSRKYGSTDGDLDFALLLDGLDAEREQGITIDVAYRFFSTPDRKFILADAPGHEQYTRNMATAASTADVAIVLIDATKGVLPQTRRHSFILSLFGVRYVLLAVNKMDLVNYDQVRFDEIEAAYGDIVETLSISSVGAIPTVARTGDNIVHRGDTMSWYAGPTLIEALQAVEIDATRARSGPFRLPVQWVNRPHANFRGYAGSVVSGSIRVGDQVVIAQSGVTTRVARIVTADADVPSAAAEDAVTLVLTDDVDISRGDLLCSPTARPEVANQFAAHLLWMHEQDLVPGRAYLLKAGPFSTIATITALKHKIDVQTYAHRPARSLAINEIGLCNLQTHSAFVFDAYAINRDTGGFILIDRWTHATVAAGTIQFALRRSANIHPQRMDVTVEQRSALNGHKPAVIWFTGLSGSGKSTIANALELRLHQQGCHTYALDGDNVRHGLNRDLGFTEADRVENIRRVAEVARLMADAGLIVTCSFISPFRSEREMARELIGADRFIEVFVNAPIETCMERDPKGLYAKAKAGEIKNFTGFDSPYEEPLEATVALATDTQTVDDCVRLIFAELEQRAVLR
jgi:bifunctional enzyme CysN/CysC